MGGVSGRVVRDWSWEGGIHLSHRPPRPPFPAHFSSFLFSRVAFRSLSRIGGFLRLAATTPLDECEVCSQEKSIDVQLNMTIITITTKKMSQLT